MTATAHGFNLDTLAFLLDKTLFDPAFVLVPFVALLIRDGYKLRSTITVGALLWWLIVLAVRV